jgi:hypothetical protein
MCYIIIQTHHGDQALTVGISWSKTIKKKKREEEKRERKEFLWSAPYAQENNLWELLDKSSANDHFSNCLCDPSQAAPSLGLLICPSYPIGDRLVPVETLGIAAMRGTQPTGPPIGPWSPPLFIVHHKYPFSTIYLC